VYSGIIINVHDNYRGIFGQKRNLIDRKVALIVDVPFEIDNCLKSGDLQRAIGIGGGDGGGRVGGAGRGEKERIAQEEKRIRLISNFRDVNPLTNYWSSLQEGYKLEAHLISRLFHLSAKERTCTRAYVHECVRA